MRTKIDIYFLLNFGEDDRLARKYVHSGKVPENIDIDNYVKLNMKKRRIMNFIPYLIDGENGIVYSVKNIYLTKKILNKEFKVGYGETIHKPIKDKHILTHNNK